MDDIIRDVDDLLHRLRQAQMRPAFRERLLDGLPNVSGVGTLRILRAIERAEQAGGVPSIRTVADVVAIEHSTASRAVQALVDRGLVERAINNDDQRRVDLRLSTAGREVVTRATENRRVTYAAVLDAWDPADRRHLADLLGRLVAGLDQLETDSVDVAS